MRAKDCTTLVLTIALVADRGAIAAPAGMGCDWSAGAGRVGNGEAAAASSCRSAARPLQALHGSDSECRHRLSHACFARTSGTAARLRSASRWPRFAGPMAGRRIQFPLGKTRFLAFGGWRLASAVAVACGVRSRGRLATRKPPRAEHLPPIHPALWPRTTCAGRSSGRPLQRGRLKRKGPAPNPSDRSA